MNSTSMLSTTSSSTPRRAELRIADCGFGIASSAIRIPKSEIRNPVDSRQLDFSTLDCSRHVASPSARLLESCSGCSRRPAFAPRSLVPAPRHSLLSATNRSSFGCRSPHRAANGSTTIRRPPSRRSVLLCTATAPRQDGLHTSCSTRCWRPTDRWPRLPWPLRPTYRHEAFRFRIKVLDCPSLPRRST